MSYVGRKLKVNTDMWGIPRGHIITITSEYSQYGGIWYISDYIIPHSNIYWELSALELSYSICQRYFILLEEEEVQDSTVENHEGMIQGYDGEWRWF